MSRRNLVRIEGVGSMVDLQMRVAEYGFLPMFQNAIAGFSVYEASRNFWDNDEGPWEWKGPILRDGECAYGKFFKRKAVWISREWLPEFVNYRRSIKYAHSEDWQVFDETVLQTIVAEGSVTSRELTALLGLARLKRRSGDLVNTGGRAPRINMDTVLARLMMGGRLCIADFVYNIDRHGKRYGWGIAKYSTPEALYHLRLPDCSPEDSLLKIQEHLQRMLPGVEPNRILSLIT